MIPGGYCNDCKWWEKDFDICPGWGSCMLTLADSEGQVAYQWTKARVHPEMTDSLLTQSEFGCIQWETKEESTPDGK